MAENYFGITDTGKQRSNNEDTFIAQPAGNKNYLLACVIDGVGGYAGGEVAAEIARDTIIEQLNNVSDNVESAIVAALQLANDKIFNARTLDKKHDSMACVCTLAVVDLQNNQLTYGHVGDTRLYLFRDGSLIKITSDHSFVGFLEDSGRLTEEAAMNHPKRNEINKALGFEGNIASQQNYIETGNSPFLPGDVLLLCSDGLTDMVTKQDIITILNEGSSLKEKAKHLIDLANHNGGHDNVTAVLVKNDRRAATQEIITPVAQKKRADEPAVEATVSDTDVEKESNVTEAVRPAKKSGRGANKFVIVILVLMITAFIAATIYTAYQKKQSADAAKPVTQTAVVTQDTTVKASTLQGMLDSLKTDTLKLKVPQVKAPLTLTKSTIIKKDTLFIKGDGQTVIGPAAGFNGPAFILPKNCKLIVMSNLTFDGFKTAITTYNNALVLKNVKFSNCEVPVQVSLTTMNNAAVSGWLPDHVLKSDTSAKAVKK
ncbi:PP2C family protein-serine/threonine phosphatase [Mucilaginibacter straminoryzae]|nr:protein phosphatase 2C domain-containing protein [Mucilaginibacter straminoryzae]